jgi:hypothetical protein
MDNIRRQTLKRIAAIAASSGSLTIAGSSLAETDKLRSSNKADTGQELPELADIKVHTRVSSSSNDIEVVITNTGNQSARITQLTPSHTTTKRGVFNFSTLMKDGDFVLDAKKSVTVPMTPHAVAIDGAPSAAQHAQTLTRALRASFSAVTEHSAFAKVDVMDGLRFT